MPLRERLGHAVAGFGQNLVYNVLTLGGHAESESPGSVARRASPTSSMFKMGSRDGTTGRSMSAEIAFCHRVWLRMR